MTGTAKQPVLRVVDGAYRAGVDDLAIEAQIRITSEAGHGVELLATPLDLEDLSIGHAICEGWLHPSDVLPTGERSEVEGTVVLHLSGASWTTPLPHRSILPSCGGCGLTLNPPSSGTFLPPANRVEPGDVEGWVLRLQDKQPLFSTTGGTHAAALVTEDGFIVREDIGRHSAVDKVIGAWGHSSSRSSARCLMVSGRCGWDVMAKAVRAGVRQVIALGAVSAQAAELARHEGMLVVGFAAGHRPQFLGSWSS